MIFGVASGKSHVAWLKNIDLNSTAGFYIKNKGLIASALAFETKVRTPNKPLTNDLKYLFLIEILQL
jgi:hypothetical protein